MESQWEILPEVFQQLLSTSPAEPLLLWSNGPWLTLLQAWERPFEQHDIVDFAHFLLPHGSHHCPVKLYLCDGKNGDTTELQERVTTWSLGLESYGLQALSGVSDLLCMQIDRLDHEGQKSFQKLQWTSPIFLLYFTDSFWAVTHTRDTTGQHSGMEQYGTCWTMPSRRL